MPRRLAAHEPGLSVSVTPSCDNPRVKGPAPSILFVVFLAAAVPAPGEEPGRLGGGFGRPVPTRTPTPRSMPRSAPAGSPTAKPVLSATTPASPAQPAAAATPKPGAVSTALPAAPARPTAPAARVRPAGARVAPTPPRAAADVSVGYVLVPFVVTDRKGRPVPDLKEKDVTLLSDGAPVAYDLFQGSSDAPVSYAVLLDGSGSMGLAGKMEGARAAIEALAATRVPGDDFALFVFAESEVREVVPFTGDATKLSGAARQVKPWGKTAFRDALARMPEKSLQGKNGSRAIVLLSDGIDNDSELTESELAKLMEGVDVPVFPLGIRSPGALMRPLPGMTVEWMLNIDVLSQIARITGGRMAVVDDPALLPARILDIQKDLRSQYLIGFSPTGHGPVRYRRLTLRVAGSARPVRVRAGYRGSDPPAHGPRSSGTK